MVLLLLIKIPNGCDPMKVLFVKVVAFAFHDADEHNLG
jgi:hypothetical protein